MSVIGTVSVTIATVVKAVALIGMAASAFALFEPATAIMVHGVSEFGQAVPGLIGMAASVAGWNFADWVDGKLHVSTNKAAQEAELARLQEHQGRHINL